jgi:hypothetical protein
MTTEKNHKRSKILVATEFPENLHIPRKSPYSQKISIFPENA